MKEERMQFVAKIINFLIELRECNPDAYILWTYSMLGTFMMPSIRQAVDSYQERSNDKRVAFVELPEMTENTAGGRRHPGLECHKQAAAVFIEELNKVLR